MQIILRTMSAFAILSVLIVQSVNACLWDRDTLAMEAEHFPGITEIITGRFDRYPDLYYEMRLERVTKELRDDPDNLSLYDDAGVACDRLGRHDEAIEWMMKKRAALDALDTPDDVHEYRYLANLGTFHIHRWLSNGANREDLADAEISRDLIARAIELNPDAHFGRERYQLLAIEWILNLDELEYTMGQSLLHQIPEYMYTRGSNNNKLAELGFVDATKGLMGLIVLGNAWQSIDVYYALAFALGDQDHTVLAQICMMRVREIHDSGGLSLYPDFNYTQIDHTPGRQQIEHEYAQRIEDWYEDARAEADAWVARRQQYMTTQLVNGRHPDTHADFWNDWKETTSPPSMPTDRKPLLTRDNAIFVAACAGICACVLWVMRRMKKPRPTTA